MALGNVQINNLNLLQGPFTEFERFLLFTGAGTGTSDGQLLTVNNSTDLDNLLGENASPLKTQVEHARLNAGQNWNAAVLPLASGNTWEDGVDYAMTQTNAEGVVVTDPVTSSTEVEAMQGKTSEIMGQYMRPLFFIAVTEGVNSETWAEYAARIKPLTNGLACENVTVVPGIWGFDQGTFAGRLCDKSVTVADTPMRVNTGALQGEWSAKPVDSSGLEIDMSVLADLDKARFSVPQWYPDYPGMYWGDGNMLDVPGGDYQSIENLRVVHKAMRRIYPLAVARIGDRKLNSTPASIESNKTYFQRPLREMSKSAEILGTVFPGEIHPPKDDAIQIIWKSKYEVEIYLTVQPYNCPKSITINIALDLRNYG